jgi:DNA-binding transcriptional ArsR family regulator
MVTRRKRTLVIRDAEKLRTLRTPLRREILEALIHLGRSSVKELASELGRAPAALYYHVHELARAGLIREVESRSVGKRLESVYGPAAPRIVIDRTVRKPAFIEALADLQRSTLRTAERELTRALGSSKTGDRSAADSTSLIRSTARLRPKAAVRARKMLRELARFMAENDDPDAPDTYAVTAALVPLGRRSRSK